MMKNENENNNFVDEQNADEIIAKLKLNLEQKKAELNEAETAVLKQRDRCNKILYKYNGLPSLYDTFLVRGVTGVISGIATGVASRVLRDGGSFRPIDNIKEYFLNHPDMLEHAKEVTGSSNLDYISGFVTGSDSAAEALYASSGLKDFVFNNTCAASVDAAIVGTAVVTVPLVAHCVLQKYYEKKHDKAKQVWDEKSEKRYAVLKECQKMESQIKELETKKQCKNDELSL